MRAAATLRALAGVYRVTLLVAPRYRRPASALPPDLISLCEQVIDAGDGQRLSRRELFDIVHVFRLTAIDDAAPWLRFANARHLDLDELESTSGQRMAALSRILGHPAAAKGNDAEAEAARAKEDAALARFDRIYVSSEIDREALLARESGLAEIVTLPNTLPLPETTPFPPPAHAPFTLLFVGTLGYEPNADAIRFFCTDILPRIQAGAARPVTLRIVGAGAATAFRRLEAQAGVEVIGQVDDVMPWYRDAHLAVVPLRAGGGTRIKALEAFSLWRPVVTTPIGVEGIAVEDGTHAMIAGDPTTFATAVLRLLHDPALAERMAREAFALFSRAYSSDTAARTIARLAAAPPR
jgi:glycosyltransferase involved in cell wall biosynthesis